MNVKDNRIGKWICFGILYLTCFEMLESRTTEFHVIHTMLDDKIPFCEYFILPYLLWFPYVGMTILYFSMGGVAQKENDDFFAYMLWGSVIFLTISLLYPNMQDLRPQYPGEGFCAWLVRFIYRTDTPTNILPSLHVYNSVACLVAMMKNRACRQKKGLMAGACVLTFFIILSTMFLKQHSTVDVAMALFCNAAVYHIVYRMQENGAYHAKRRFWRDRMQEI